MTTIPDAAHVLGVPVVDVLALMDRAVGDMVEGEYFDADSETITPAGMAILRAQLASGGEVAP